MRGPGFDRDKRFKASWEEKRNCSMGQEGENPICKVCGDSVFSKFVGKEVWEDVVEAALYVKKESGGLYSCFLGCDDFLFKGKNSISC